MHYFGEKDLNALLDTFGQRVEYRLNGEPFITKGIVDMNDSDMLAGDGFTMAGKLFTVIVKTGALPAIGEGAIVTVDTTDYTVVQTRQMDDGALTKLYLA